MFETAGLMKSSATRRGCQTVAGGRSEGQLVPRGDLRSGMSKGRHPEEGARMGATDYGFDVLCVWHLLSWDRHRGYREGRLPLAQLPATLWQAFSLAGDWTCSQRPAFLPFRGNTCHYLALTFRSRNGQGPQTSEECGAVGN